jgi:hypothetical protein
MRGMHEKDMNAIRGVGCVESARRTVAKDVPV